MENPKDKQFNDWQEQERAEQQELKAQKAEAEKYYRDLSYGQEYKFSHSINKLLRFLCNSASCITATIALTHIYSFLMGFYFAALLAVLCSVLFELKKNEYLATGFKKMLKYKDFSRRITTPIYVSGFISIVLAIMGAFLIPTFQEKPVYVGKNHISIDSITAVQNAHILEAQAEANKIFEDHKRPRKGGGWRWSTSKKADKPKEQHANHIEFVLSERKALTSTIKQAQAQNIKIDSINQAEQQIFMQTYNDNIQLKQAFLIIIALIFEIAYLFLCYEIGYYLLRVMIDEMPEGTQKQQALNGLGSKGFVNLITTNQNPKQNSIQIKFNPKHDSQTPNIPQEPQAKTLNVMTPNVMTLNTNDKAELKPGQARCALKECGKIFEYYSKKHKFCSDDCRKLSHNKKKLTESLKKISRN